jgi:sugar phosphate isomerase/epimerase
MASPTFSVNEWSTPSLSFVEELALYSRLGVDAIGIVHPFRKFKTVPDAPARLREHGLRAGFCIPDTVSVLPRPLLQHHVPGAGDPERRVEAICDSIRELAAFDPLLCICTPGPLTTYEPDAARQMAITGLKRIARFAAELGVTIGVEPLHPTLEQFTFLHSLPDAVAMLDEIDEPNTGLVFDTWHHWDTPDVIAHIHAHADRIVGVHINDYRQPTRSWCDRVLPGDGAMDYPAMLTALVDAGYTGWYELEILSDDGRNAEHFDDSLWDRDPEELVRAGRDQFMRMWEAAARDLRRDLRQPHAS